jgi:hypothetical protein
MIRESQQHSLPLKIQIISKETFKLRIHVSIINIFISD